MKELIINSNEAGQRLDKFLKKYLRRAPGSFIYKMLRKKNIVLNKKKADGSEKTAVGDCVKIFFAQETLHKFMGGQSDQSAENDGLIRQRTPQDAGFTEKSERTANAASSTAPYRRAYGMFTDISVIFENNHILIADKPAGILSQKAEKTDISLNEWLIGYLLEKGDLSEADFSFYKPSVCNRLDRNTSGLVLCAKTLQGAQLLSVLLKDRTLHKYYQLYVKGHLAQEQLIEGYLVKDEKQNKVTIRQAPCKKNHNSVPHQTAGKHDKTKDGKAAYIQTRYKPLRIEQDKTLLEVELITGKPHQIRAHLAGIGHPLLGDYKYGDRTWNEKYRRCGVQSQLLHAYKVIFPPLDDPFADLDGRTFICEVPEIFERVSRLSKRGR